jgi:subtilisin family serine protease/fibronectin type 3 domain-containing protein/methionine-rich copper-binding protein CopC
MARSVGGVGSWWLRLLKPVSVQKRLVRSRQRVTLRARTHAARLLGCELLEDRTLLALDSAAAWADFSTLRFDPDDYDPAHVLVRFDNGIANPADYLQTLSNSVVRGAEIAATLPLVPGLQRVRLTGGLSLDAALAALRGDPHILYAEPDYRVRIAGLSTDPRFSEQWDFHNSGQSGGTIDADIDAPEAWDLTTGTGRTLVAVIDTGVDYRHPDLAANIWVNADELPGNHIDDDNNGYTDDVHGYDFYNNDGNPLDDHNHGTHVAGTIGAVGNNGSGVAGVNWDVQIMALKFLGSDGSGTTSDAIEAVRYAVANGAQISNNSWGGDPFSQSLFDAIREARDAGHVFVAAAGNGDFLGFGLNNDAEPFYPASYNLDNIVTVAATDHSDRLAVFSNFGASSVDLAAPGVSILSTTRNNAYDYSSGTSMAAPHVAGALSLLWDYEPGLTYRQVIDRVLGAAEPLDSLSGMTVTGGRLNVASSLVPDTFGPRVAAIHPSGLTLDPMDRVRINFDEAIDPATFTLAAVAQFTGPNGAIGNLALVPVTGTNSRQFDLRFSLQSAPGRYELVISPGILDKFGNVMDQDDDGVGGETLDDRFVGEFTLADTVARFDFGTVDSPVATHYTRVTRNDRYSAAVGYGWQLGTVSDISRGTGTDLTRDVNFTHDGTFAVDLPNGQYDVIATIGDTSLAHDLVGVFVEGAQFDMITTSAGQTVTRIYHVGVSDGQLNLRLADLGGSDWWAMICGLDIVFAGPDTAGPQIVSSDPADTAGGPIDHITLIFNEPIDESSFTLADIVLLNGPSGAIASTAVNHLAIGQVEVTFPPQNTSGSYRLVIGPNIVDRSGNLLDQDGDGTGGESPDDRYETIFVLEAGPEYVARIDFGTTTSPVTAGYTQVTRNDRYSAAVGYGWLLGSVSDISRGTGTDLTRDVNFTHDGTFAIDLASGEYDVIPTIGDTSLAHDLVGVFLEGVEVDTITTAGGQTVTRTYRVSVSDGQLNLRLADLGGSDWWAMICGLDVIFVGPDRSGPRIDSTDPAGTATGPVDHITLTFNEPVDESSFTLNDIALVEGPAGAIAPSAVNHLAGGQVHVVFPPQNTSGVYRVAIGPEIQDRAGNFMDQDGDGVGGEMADDRFETTFVLQAGPEYVGRFDFGTVSSPVAAGYTQITRNHRYSAAAGYGWQLGSVSDISRGTGTDLTRDVNFTHDGTFALDLANGQYDVVATIGDTVLAHDLVGVFIEGMQLDTITTAGGQTVTRTYRVGVADGQLNLRLADLGGSDWWAMINGLEVVAVAGQSQSIASIAVAEFDAALAEHDRSASNRKLPAASISHAAARFADVRNLDLLHSIAARPQSRQTVLNNLMHAARDEALSSLFDDMHPTETIERLSAIRHVRIPSLR